ncbi:MFS transporter [Williamsia sp.]|uniref:MFS transporter n=1 Tax=Williamsia sp. TaxID=1872085 RepID=UPI002F942756
MDTSGGAPPRDRLGFRAIWLIVVACAALSMVIAAMASLNTAIPEIAPEIGANSNQVTWLIDGYTLTIAALLLPAGAIGDRYGRREVLVGGLVVFAIGSLLPIWVSNPDQFIAARALTGVGAAFVMPATLSVITAGVPETKRHLAVSIWAGVGGSGGIAGFFVTGVLLEFFSWESIFLTFGISAAITTVLACTIPTSKDSTTHKFDWIGSFTSAVGIGLLVFGLIEAPHRGWFDPLSLSALIGGLALIGVFWWWQLRYSDPLLDVRLFNNRAFSAGTLSITVQFLVIFGIFLVLLQQLQLVFGYSPLKAAVALMPMVVLVMVFSLIGNWLTTRTSLRLILVFGMTAMGVGAIYLGAVRSDDYRTIVIAMLILAVGLGIATAPSTTAIMVNTPTDNQGVGSAVNDTARELGSAIGIALGGSLLAAGYTRNIEPVARDAEASMQQLSTQLDAAGQTAQAQEAAAAAGTIGEHITNTLAEALQVAAQLSPVDPELAARITSGAIDAFEGPMSASCLALGGVCLATAVGLAVFAPKQIDDGTAERAAADEQAKAAITE